MKLDATTDKDKGYFHEAMKAVYTSCSNDFKGKDSGKRRAAHFLAKVTEVNGVYMAIHDQAKKTLDTQLSKYEGNVTRQVAVIFKEMRTDFNNMFSTKENDSPEASALRAKLRAMVPDARELLNGEVKRHLADCLGVGLRSK